MTKRVFVSYSHADAQLLERLHKHLTQLQREDSIAGWYDRDIRAGRRLDDEIKLELSQADIFIACVSPDYIASNYCYERELSIALERERRGELAIVPVILEPSDWLSTPLAKFKAVPDDGKPVSEFTNPNVAFLQVVNELRRLVLEPQVVRKAADSASAASDQAAPQHSRYRVKREFDALAKRDFVEAAFQEIYKFFEASVAELSGVPELEARLSQPALDHFSCTVINRGISRGYETLHIRRGGSFGAIDILYGDTNTRNTSNGGFGVEGDEYQLYLKPVLFSMMGKEDRLTAREAAQMLWDDLLSKVGVGYV
ncbi:MAG TPA: toll/interleukin-1 receptor domain-containing protein [Nitrosospira sp.]|nr:toll/interleukin-1 receptor domain-containing protein [Nitrosospira sp.]